MSDPQLGFGAIVRVRATPATEAAGLAGLAGTVFGYTTPSSSGVEVCGTLHDDFAINVFVEARGVDVWLDPSSLEVIDDGTGTELRLDGVPKRWVKRSDGSWAEISERRPR